MLVFFMYIIFTFILLFYFLLPVTGRRYSQVVAGKEVSEGQKSDICLKYTLTLKDTDLI